MPIVRICGYNTVITLLIFFLTCASKQWTLTRSFGGKTTMASKHDPPAADTNTSNEHVKKKIKRYFQDEWKTKYTWLTYKDNLMFCDQCIKYKKKNAMCSGVDNFRTSTLVSHAESREHRDSVIADCSAQNMATLLTKRVSKDDEALIAALQSVYYMVQHDISTNQYSDLTFYCTWDVNN